MMDVTSAAMPPPTAARSPVQQQLRESREEILNQLIAGQITKEEYTRRMDDIVHAIEQVVYQADGLLEPTTKIYRVPRLNSTATKRLAQKLANNHTLTVLDASNTAMTATTDQNIGGQNFGGDMTGVREFIAIIPTMNSITQLDISGNQIRSTGGKALAQAFKNNCILKVLNIGDNSLNKNAEWDLDLSGVRALANTISTMQALENLDISQNEMCATSGKAIAKALRGNSVITALNLSRNSLCKRSFCNYYTDVTGFVDIANAIGTMNALTSLDISRNQIAWAPSGTEASVVGKALAVALRKNAILERLNVSDNIVENNTLNDWKGFTTDIVRVVKDINKNRIVTECDIMQCIGIHVSSMQCKWFKKVWDYCTGSRRPPLSTLPKAIWREIFAYF